MIPIIKWTMRQRQFSTIMWSIGVAAYIFINMIVYPVFKNQAAELNKSLAKLPGSTVQLFGGTTDFFSPVGFMNSKIFFFMLPLLLIILAIGLGSSLIAREEQDKTIASLLARPISRSRLLLAKALAGFMIMLVVTVVSLVAMVVLNAVENIGLATGSIAVATLACFMLALATGAIALLLTATGRARGGALGIAGLIAVGGYLVSSLSGTVSWLRIPARLFPFHYYRSEAILSGTYEWKYLLVFVGIILVAGILSWLFFRRRDLA